MNFKHFIIFSILIISFSPISVSLSKEDSATEELVANIDIPRENALVRADVPIFGLAYGRNFKKYTVEYGEGPEPQEWVEIITSTTPQREDVAIKEIAIGDQTLHGNLATWKTGLSNYVYGEHPVDLNGIYTVRLLVFGKDGKKIEDRITIEVGRVISIVYGGVVESKDKKVILSIPEQAIESSFKVFGIKPVLDKDISISSCYRLVSKIYTIRPQGEKFIENAALKIKYSDSDIKSLDEKKLGLYSYNPYTSKWEYMDTCVDFENNALTTTLSGITPGIAYYCILAKIKPPSRPLMYKPYSPTPLKLIAAKGETDINTEVEIFVDGESQGKATPDKKTGIFTLENVLLKKGKNVIKAKAIDPFRQSSPFSKSVVCYVTTHSPKKIKYLRFMKKSFLHPKDEPVELRDKLYIELKGEDINPHTIDATDVKLLSEDTDSKGIKVQLFETGHNTGVYRGIVSISKNSSRRERKIGVRRHNEVIKVISMTDSNKQDKVVFSDSIPPPAPKIISKTHPSLIQNTFEDGFGPWSERDKYKGASLSLESSKDKTQMYLKLTNKNYGGNFASTVVSKPFNAKEYPFISFDYKISPDIEINFLVKVNKRWYEIEFTDKPKGYLRLNIENIGKIENIVADNRWHTASFNLYRLLGKIVDIDTYPVEEIIMADWDESGYMKLKYGKNKKDTSYFIDNFKITKLGFANSNCEFMFTAKDDLSKDLEYSFCFDQNLATLPDTVSEGPKNFVSYRNIADGKWYFHVRAKDEAGNWGKANHYWLKIDTKCPTINSTTPFNGSHSAEDKIALHLIDAEGVGVAPETIKLKINNREYDVTTPALNYNQASETLTFTASLTGTFFKDKEKVTVELSEARDFCDNSIKEPVKFNFVIDYSKDTIKPDPPKIYSLVSYAEDKNLASFSWDSDEPLLIKGYSFLIDQNPKTKPGDKIDSSEKSKVYTDLGPGGWYFHIRCQDRAGNWSKTAHCKINIDDIKNNSILKVDDFDDGESPNKLGGKPHYFTNPKAGGECTAIYCKEESGYLLELNYKVLGPEDYAGYWTSLEGIDLRNYNSLNFWVKDIKGDELMRVGLRDSTGIEPKVHIYGYLTGEYTNGWQKISIPLACFSEIKDWSKVERLSFAFENWIGLKKGLVCIDNIYFAEEVPPLTVDNFNVGRESINFLGGGNWIFSNGLATIKTDYIKENIYKERDYCYQISYTGVKAARRDGTPGTYCGYITILNNLDVSKYNTLSFWIKGKRGLERPNIYFDNGAGDEYTDNQLDLEEYVDISTSWQKVNIPLIDFVKQGVDISLLKMFKIVFEWDDMDGTIYIDDIKFVTRLEP